MSATHTPLPWKLYHQIFDTYLVDRVSPERRIENIGSITMKSGADAKFLIHAANSHDALVEALETILALVETELDYDAPQAVVARDLVKRHRSGK